MRTFSGVSHWESSDRARRATCSKRLVDVVGAKEPVSIGTTRDQVGVGDNERLFPCESRWDPYEILRTFPVTHFCLILLQRRELRRSFLRDTAV